MHMPLLSLIVLPDNQLGGAHDGSPKHRVMLNEAGDVENAFLGCLAKPVEQGVLELVPRY